LQAYNEHNFSHPRIAPLYHLHKEIHLLELWHGPTAAFKDMALQLMPHLLSRALEKGEQREELVILVATSGDTGKAALEGFADVPGIRIIVFYPSGGVSRVQELQMTTTMGANTHVVAVRGNFDDCQAAVKDIFADREIKTRLKEDGFALSSANSINWGRLLPQIVYYFWAWLQLTEQKRDGSAPSEPLNIVVPTGNFGNILAAWYAWKMGLPVKKLICASNENRVLTDFFQSGVYDSNREFRRTSSPSMDILVSGNLERLLFAVSGKDDVRTQRWMDELKKTGIFKVDAATRQSLERIIHAGCASEAETMCTIRETYTKYGYLLDTHTAVGLSVYNKYRADSTDTVPAIIAATASPFKFSSSVLAALRGNKKAENLDEFTTLTELSRLSGATVHPALQDLQQKTVRHNLVCDRDEIGHTIMEILSVR
jgi:threonine synthase